MSLFKKLKQVIEWPTKLSATMGPQSPRATVPSRPKLSFVRPLTSEEINAAQHTDVGRAIAAQLSDIPSRSDNPEKPVFNTDTKPAETAPSSGTATLPAPPKKSWGSLRDTFKKHASSTVRNVILPAAAGYGVKQAAAYALALLPGGFVIGVAVGASASLLTGLAHDRIKGQKSSWKKHFARAVTGAVSGVIGVEVADGFEHVQRFGSFLKDTFAPVALPVPNAARVAAQAASSAARAVSASVAQAVTSSGAAQAVAVSTNDFMNEVRRLQEKDQIRQAREQAARMAAKAKEAARRAANAAQEARIQALQREWNSAPITETRTPNSVGGSAPSESGASSTLTRGARPSLSAAASSVPSAPQVPVAAVDTAPSVGVADTGTPVADAGRAPANGVQVSLQTAAGEVSGDPARVVALQQELAAAAAPAKQFSDGSILTAEAGVSINPPAKILGNGEVLRPTTGYPTGGDQLAHAGGGTGRDARFSPAY